MVHALQVDQGWEVGRLEAENDRLRKELRHTKLLWSKLFHPSPNVMSINTIADGRFVELNEACAAIGGFRREELLGRRMEDFDLLDDPGFREVVNRKLREEGRVCNLQSRIRTKEGEVRTVLFSAEPLTLDDEPCMLTTSIDITEREREADALRRTEEKLRESEEYLGRIINRIGDAVFVKDHEHHFTLVNDAFCAFVGASREKLLGTPDILSPIAPRLWEEEEEVLATGRERLTEEESCNADGSRVYVQTKKSLLIDKRGNRQVVGVLRDITERKRLEAQFQQAQKMEAVGTLAGGVAHDFNNLLNVINGYADLLLEELPPRAAMSEELEQIRDAGKRAAALTSQLLDFGRKQMLQPEVFDLDRVIGDMRSLIRSMVRENIEIEVTHDRAPARVHADPTKMQQVVMNLVVNARDAMPGGGRLRIETGTVDVRRFPAGQHPPAGPGPYVRLAVGDTGVGMDPETRAHIFEPFFTTKPQGKGTGLGLATVYGIVIQSGGFVRVTSRKGEGALIEVFFPSSAEEALPSPAESRHATEDGGRETVLLVEDQEALRTLAARVLSERGYRVLEAPDGTEALRIAREHDGGIDLVLTDVVMPGMGGPALVSRLEEARPGIRSLYISGYTEEAISHRGIFDGSVAFLQKPFTPRLLARKVRETLDACAGPLPARAAI